MILFHFKYQSILSQLSYLENLIAIQENQWEILVQRVGQL